MSENVFFTFVCAVPENAVKSLMKQYSLYHVQKQIQDIANFLFFVFCLKIYF